MKTPLGYSSETQVGESTFRTEAPAFSPDGANLYYTEGFGSSKLYRYSILTGTNTLFAPWQPRG